MHIRTPIYNALAVTNENECTDPLLIKAKITIKWEGNRSIRNTQFWYQKLNPSRILLQYTSTEFFSNLIIGGFLANTTPAYFFFPISFIIAGSSLGESFAITHLHRRELNWRFFASSYLFVRIEPSRTLLKNLC